MIFLMSLLSYLIGSIPSGYLLTKHYKGIDIRKHGSGNIGATNVTRVSGSKLGNITKVCDISKGIIPILIGDILIKTNVITYNRDILLSTLCICVILGHNYTIFLGFKGGKGVATTIASFAYVLPLETLIALGFFFGLKVVTKIVSVRSMAFGFILFISTLILKGNSIYSYMTFIAFILILIRHKANIVRLVNGEEK